ncbi:MAG: DNA-binding protein [Spirulinaceae cyanobacterium]
MAQTQVTPWDAADYLETKADRLAYLEAALEDGWPPVVALALKDIARAQGITDFDQASVLGADGTLDFDAVSRLADELGLSFTTTSI